MGSFHWLILVPYYFFGALALLAALVVVTRVLRLKLSINALVITSIVTTLLALAVPLTLGWVELESFTGLYVAVLLVASFVFAAIDAILKRQLPLPLDAELEFKE